MIKIDESSKKPKYKQIVSAVIASIASGKFQIGQQLPSINELADQEQMAKATVAIAYNLLRQNGIISSQPGKGFYIATSKPSTQLNIFMLFDTLNPYKEILYNSLKESLPPGTRFSIFFHHYNLELFGDLIRNSIGNYNHYVIMPHFDADVSGLLKEIPREQLLLLDKDVPSLGRKYSAVYQDFENDITDALESATATLRKYKRIHLCLGSNQFQYVPAGIQRGFKKYCRKNNFEAIVENKLSAKDFVIGDAYIVFSDSDLISFARHAALMKWKIGKDIGLISYDDTPVKEIMLGGVTVISTDFKQMGETAADFIQNKKAEKRANSASLIMRTTL